MSAPRSKGQPQVDIPRSAWSVKEFAATLGVSIDTVYRQIYAGQLATFKFGGEYRIPNTELDRLMSEAQQTRTGLAEVRDITTRR